jgi:ribosomal protein S3AE
MVEKKKFFDIELPLIGEKIKLSAFELENLDNRNIKMDMSRALRGKSLEAVFKVKVKENKAEAHPIKITLLGFFIRRMMRKSVSYVEDSFSAECTDAILRIKPFLITRKKVTRAVRKALRDEARKYLEEYMKDKNKDDIFSDILNNKLQKSLSPRLKKIYPLALCEIRRVQIEKEKEVTSEVKEEKKEEIKAEITE